MQNNYELPKLKEKNSNEELLQRSLIEYQYILLAKLEENKKYNKKIEENNQEIALLQQKIDMVNSMIKPDIIKRFR